MPFLAENPLKFKSENEVVNALIAKLGPLVYKEKSDEVSQEQCEDSGKELKRKSLRKQPKDSGY